MVWSSSSGRWTPLLTSPGSQTTSESLSWAGCSERLEVRQMLPTLSTVYVQSVIRDMGRQPVVGGKFPSDEVVVPMPQGVRSDCAVE